VIPAIMPAGTLSHRDRSSVQPGRTNNMRCILLGFCLLAPAMADDSRNEDRSQLAREAIGTGTATTRPCAFDERTARFRLEIYPWLENAIPGGSAALRETKSYPRDP